MRDGLATAQHKGQRKCCATDPFFLPSPADAFLVELSPDSANPGYINASYVDVSAEWRSSIGRVPWHHSEDSTAPSALQTHISCSVLFAAVRL